MVMLFSTMNGCRDTQENVLGNTVKIFCIKIPGNVTFVVIEAETILRPCSRTFTEQWALNKHVRLHTGTYTYMFSFDIYPLNHEKPY